MSNLVPYSDREFPTVVDSAIRSISLARGISAAMIDTVASAATASLLPIIRRAQMAIAHQAAQSWVVSRFEFYTNWFGGRHEQVLRNSYTFCRSVSAIPDRDVRFRFMHIIVMACETDYQKAIAFMDEMSNQLVENGFDEIRGHAAAEGSSRGPSRVKTRRSTK